MALLRCRRRGVEMDVFFTGDMTVSAALKVRSALARIRSEKSILFRFDFSAIESADITFLQLIISFAKTISQEGRRIVFVEEASPSPPMLQAELCGINLRAFGSGGDNGI